MAGIIKTEVEMDEIETGREIHRSRELFFYKKRMTSFAQCI